MDAEGTTASVTSPDTPDAPTPSVRVPKRKPHHKSRQGCFQCKRRHYKCNEEHPKCANCTRLRIECNWPTASTEGLSPDPESHIPVRRRLRRPLPDIVSSSDLPVDLTDLPIDDMRLLHHWTTETCKSLPTAMETPDESAQKDFIELGFDHPFLLHGMLAVAAVHKAVMDPTTYGRALLLRADAHVSKALQTYRQLLENPTAETAVPMFLLSSTLVTYNLAAAQIEEPEDPIGAVCHCFRLIQGVKVVIGPHWEHIKDNQHFRKAATPAADLDTPVRPEDGQFPEILQLNQLTIDMIPQDREACAKAITDLHANFVRAKNCTHDRGHAMVFVWPALLDVHFSNLLSLKNPVAIIILAHFGILLTRARSKWWVHNWPDRIIMAAQQALLNTPEYLRWLGFPLQMIKYSF